MTNSQITRIIDSVNSSPSSIYSKEDVIKIIGLVETECNKNNQGLVTREDLETFIDKLKEIKSEISNIYVDENDIEFDLDGREIIVRHVEIGNRDESEEKVEELIDNMENFLIFPELKDNEVQVS